MKKKLSVPSDLSEITLGQYQRFYKIQEKNDDPYFLQCKMIEIFCNLDALSVRKMKMSDAERVANILNKMFEKKPPLTRTFNLEEKEYSFIPDLNNISFGEYIDLDTNISDWQNMHVAMNVLYRPVKQKLGEKYLIDEYNLERKENMVGMPMSVVMGSIFFFLSFRDGLIENYGELFGEQSRGSLDGISIFNRKWGWLSSLYSLAENDITRLENITKLDMHQCLTMLSYLKEKQELENKRIKSKFKK